MHCKRAHSKFIIKNCQLLFNAFTWKTMLKEAFWRLLFNIFRLILSHLLSIFFDMHFSSMFVNRTFMTRHLSYIDNNFYLTIVVFEHIIEQNQNTNKSQELTLFDVFSPCEFAHSTLTITNFRIMQRLRSILIFKKSSRGVFSRIWKNNLWQFRVDKARRWHRNIFSEPWFFNDESKQL